MEKNKEIKHHIDRVCLRFPQSLLTEQETGQKPRDGTEESAENWCSLPSGSDVVSQCGLIVMDAFAVHHTDPPAHGVGYHTSVDGRHTQRRRLQHGRGAR